MRAGMFSLEQLFYLVCSCPGSLLKDIVSYFAFTRTFTTNPCREYGIGRLRVF
jgi:hypothetical protein